MTKDAPIETILSIEVAKILKEKRFVSDGFDDTGGVRGRAFDDDDQQKRADV
jgi:hypothetical protein